MMYPKLVYLDYASSSNERLVTVEGYELIKELIARYQVCKNCHSQIDQADHLLVGKICLSCVLKKYPNMRFLGPVEVESDGDTTYAFIDEAEVIYTITANSDYNLRVDLLGSMTKAGFQPPEYYVPFRGDKNNPIKLERHNWTIYGKLTNSVIVLKYEDTYPTVHAMFLCYREGEVVELTKRNLAYKQMFERAKAVIERTKHKKGETDYYYLPDGSEISRISDEHLYPIIAQFESAVWDVQRAFLPTHTQLELIEAEEQPLQVERDSDENTPDREDVNQEENPILVNIGNEHVNKSEESLTLENQDTETPAPEVQPEQVEEEVVQPLEDDGQDPAPTTEVVQEEPDQAEPETTEPGDNDIEIGSKSRRGKRGQLSIVPKE